MIEPIEAICEEYIAAVIANAEAIDKGDSKAANRAYKRADKAVSQLRDFGSQGQEILLSLLHHPFARVRASVAVQMLKSHPIEAVRTLEEVAKLPGVEGLGAELTLIEWRKAILGN